MNLSDLGKWISGMDAMTALVFCVVAALGICGVILLMRKAAAPEKPQQ